MWICRVKLIAAALAALPVAAGAQEGGWGQLTVSQLDGVDALAVSGASPGERVLPAEAWASSDVSTAKAAVDAAPRGGRSAAALALTQTALLGAAPGPQGSEEALKHLAAARLSTLVQVGRADAAARIVQSLPRGMTSDPALAQPAAEALFAVGQDAQACNVVQGRTQGGQDPFVLRARAACFALAGETTAAEVTLELGRDLDMVDVDTTFTALVTAAGQAANGRAAAAPAPRDILEFALARSTGAPATQAWVTNAPAAVALQLARDEQADAAVRQLAVDRIAPLGVLRAAEVTAILGLRGGESGGLRGGDLDPAVARAQAYQGVVDAAGAGEKAAAIAEALEGEPGAARFLAASRVYTAELAFLPRNAQTLGFAATFVEAAAAAGQPGLARQWLRARSQGLTGGALNATSTLSADAGEPALAGEDETALIALIAVADDETPLAMLTQTARDTLQSAVDAGLAGRGLERAQLDVALLIAVGADAEPALRAAAADALGKAEPSQAAAREALAQMNAAADAGAIAETVLWAGRAFTIAGPSDAAAAVDVARALARVGQDALARQVAVEAMIAARRGI